MKARRRDRPVLLASIGMLAVTLLVAGCTSIRGIVPDAEIVPQADCDETGAAGRIPSDFEPISVTLCDEFGTVVDADGVWSGPATRHLEGDLAPLIEALNQADDPRWPGPCTAHMVIVPQLWLLDATGRAAHVTYPVDGCGQPKADAVTAALELLTVTENSVDRQQLTESEESTQVGCSIRWMPLRLAGPGELPNELPPANQIDGMRLCHYAADESRADDGFMTGTFTSGSMLSADEGRFILEAADYDVMPLIDCSRPAAAFVVAQPLVGGQDSGGVVMIEIDRCQRLIGTAGFTFASAEILALIQPQ